MSRFYDIHTHKLGHPHSIYAVQVDQTTEEPTCGLFSVGVHPYAVARFDMRWIDRLGDLARADRCVAVGETGLDFRAEYLATAKQQLAIFDEHIFLAKKLHKPLIVHCVRALPQALERLRGVQFVVHGFVGSVADFDQIIAVGGMVSLGDKLVRDAGLRARAVGFDPSRVVLETDDSDQPIDTIYSAWSSVCGADMTDQVAQNVHSLFSNL